MVERAVTPEAGFRSIGQVAGAGTSATSQAYSFRDGEAQAQVAPVLYYRLRQVDTNGQQNISPVMAVYWEQTKLTIDVYPNPGTATEPVTLKLSTVPGGLHNILIYNSLGRLVQHLPATGTLMPLPVAGLPPGVYQLVLTAAEGQPLARQRLLISRR